MGEQKRRAALGLTGARPTPGYSRISDQPNLHNVLSGSEDSADSKVTIFVVATHYVDRRIGTATFTVDIPVSAAEAAADDMKKGGFKKTDIVTAVAHLFRDNGHEDPKRQPMVANFLSAYAAQTDSWGLMKAVGMDGLWIKLMSTGSGNNLRSKTRIVCAAPKERLVEKMERVRKLGNRLPRDEYETYVISTRPEDAHITGLTRVGETGSAA